jgi:hypothetical protein
MKPHIFLRFASIFTLIHAVLHTIGGVFGKPARGAAATAFTAMQSNHFPVAGHMRSYAAFYVGFGIAVSIFLTVEAVVFWMLASLAKRDAPALRPILWAFLIAYVALAINSFAYFFAGPVVNELLIAGCLAGAIYAARPAAH